MRTKIIVDAMGGDNAPYSVVKGAVEGAREYGTDLILVGDEKQINGVLTGIDTDGVNLEIVGAASVVEMTDHPSVVQKEKRDSSMAVACELLRDGRGDVVISSGNTGALFTAATLIVRRHKGVRRSALGAVINIGTPFVLLDSGANIDVTADVLLQFAVMGNLYARCMLGIENPRIGLLNNGTEETKGPQVYQEAYALLKNSGMNFTGNCEARDLACGKFDVVVCDGFTGNIALKSLEGMGQYIISSMKGIFGKNLVTKLSALMIKDELRDFKKSVDHTGYGGAPFLGISKPVIKSHGSATEKSIMSTIRQARDYNESGLNAKIAESLSGELEEVMVNERKETNQ